MSNVLSEDQKFYCIAQHTEYCFSIQCVFHTYTHTESHRNTHPHTDLTDKHTESHRYTHPHTESHKHTQINFRTYRYMRLPFKDKWEFNFEQNDYLNWTVLMFDLIGCNLEIAVLLMGIARLI